MKKIIYENASHSFVMVTLINIFGEKYFHLKITTDEAIYNFIALRKTQTRLDSYVRGMIHFAH